MVSTEHESENCKAANDSDINTKHGTENESMIMNVKDIDTNTEEENTHNNKVDNT